MLSRGHTPPLNPTTLVFFIAGFLLFAIQEGLYGNCRRTLGVEWGVAAKAILWTTLLTSLALRCSSSKPAWLPLVLLSSMSACVLCVTRRTVQAGSGRGATGVPRKWRIWGSGA